VIEAASEQPRACRDQHCLVGAENLRRLRHEVHAGLDDHFGVGLRRLARKRQRIADESATQWKISGVMLVVRQNEVFFSRFKPVDRPT